MADPVAPPDPANAIPDPIDRAPPDPANAVADHSTSLGDALKSLLTGLGRGVLEAPGVAGDVANLSSLGIGKLMPYLGMPDTGQAWQDEARKGLAGQNGFDMGSASIAKLLDAAGILDYQPHGDLAQKLSNVAHFTGGALSTGGTGILKEGLKEGLPAALKLAATDATVGTGAGVGAQAGREAANAAGIGDDSPWTRALMEIAPAVLGGAGAGKLAGRLPGIYEPDPLLAKFKAAGVDPHFATDVNPDPGVVGKLVSSVLPGRVGAQGVSRDHAIDTQNQISGYGESLFAGGPSVQAQGEQAQALAVQAVARMQAEVKQAYLNLNKTMGDTAVPLSNTNAALKDLASQTTDPEVAALLQTPQMQRLAPILSKSDLTWPDVEAVRREIGESMHGQVGSDLSKLQKLYGSVSDDMRSASNTVTGGQNAFTKATNLATDNNAEIDSLRANLIDTVSPEMIPSYLTQQVGKGDSRLSSFFKALSGDDGPQPLQVDGRGWPIFDLAAKLPASVDQGAIGRQLMGNAATKGGDFDLPTLMKFFTNLSPTGKAALLQDPKFASEMDNLDSVWKATAQSRGLANRPEPSILSDPLAALSGLGGLFHAVQGGGALSATAAAAAYPVAAGVAARVSQMPSLVRRFASPSDAVGPASKYGLPLGSAAPNISPDLFDRNHVPTMTIHPDQRANMDFPDTYTPPVAQQHAEMPSGAQVQAWLGSTDRASAAAYVGSKLGPQAAQQIAATDDGGYKAALFSLFSDPASRRALAS